MKKNLAKKIVLGLLTGAVLMSSSVAWADGYVYMAGNDTSSNAMGDRGIAVGYNSAANGANSIAIGANPSGGGSSTRAGGVGSISIGVNSNAYGESSIAIGTGSDIIGSRGVAIGANTKSNLDSVALGAGSIADVSDVVSVGHGGEGDVGPATRSIINVADVPDWDAKTGENYTYGSYAVNVNTLNEAIESVKAANVDLGEYAKTADVYTKTEADATFVKIENNKIDTNILIVENTESSVKTNTVTISADDGITVGTNSAHIDEAGFYACNGGTHDYNGANAAMTKDGRIKGAGGKFEVGADGSVKAADGNFTVDANGNVTANNIYNKTEIDASLALKANAADVYTKTETDTALNGKADKDSVYTKTEADGLLDAKANKVDVYTKTEVDGLLGNSSSAIAGLNQRLDKTNAKINKVGAGAAALAALHPLEYDPDDKLTFSAGMGNYAGENAAALGAFYRPNEKFMVSLGGTMGNGENMVNLGLSIGLDKPNGYTKLSKRELIQKVNAMEAKYEAVEAENEAMKAEMAEMKAMLQAILAKK